MNGKVSMFVSFAIILILIDLGQSLPNEASGMVNIHNGILFICPGRAYDSLQEAIDLIDPGGTLYLDPGTYHGDVSVNKSLTIIGSGDDSTVIQGTNSTYVMTINSDQVKLSGVSITGSGVGNNYASLFIHASDCEIRDCSVNNSRWTSILISGERNIIRDSFVSGGQNNGIYLESSSNNWIENCSIDHKLYHGIVISDGSDDNSIVDNDIEYNGGNGNGGNGVYITKSTSNNLARNNIIGNDRYGVEINPFDRNVSENMIYHNSFIDNSMGEALDEGLKNTWSVNGKGNYWQVWARPDNDSDGIVDLPFTIPGKAGSKDLYPLARPFSDIGSAPSITSIFNSTAYVDAPYRERLSASDQDTDPDLLKWTVTSNASWLTFERPWMKGTPSQADIGSYWVRIEVTDGLLSEIMNITLKVIVDKVPPFLFPVSIPSEPVSQYNIVQIVWTCYDLPAFDMIDIGTNVLKSMKGLDGATVAGIRSQLPDDVALVEGVDWGIEMDYDHRYLTFWFNNTQQGIWGKGQSLKEVMDLELVIEVYDRAGNKNTTVQGFHVRDVNDPPQIVDPPTFFAKVGIITRSFMEATDIDSAPEDITWSIDTAEAFISVNRTTGEILCHPYPTDVGRYSIDVYAQDRRGGSGVGVLEIEVVKNNPPAIRNISSSILNTSGNVYSFSVDVMDPDGDILNVTWLMDNTTVLGYGRKLNLSLSHGAHNITVRITDISNASCYYRFLIEVEGESDGRSVDPSRLVVLVIVSSLVILLAFFILFQIVRIKDRRRRVFDLYKKKALVSMKLETISDKDDDPTWIRNRLEADYIDIYDSRQGDDFVRTGKMDEH